MRSSRGLGSVSTGELVESVAAELLELANREFGESAAECLELAELLGAALDVGEAALAALVGALDRAGEASRQSYAGTRGFLKVALGMKTGRADERLTVARQLPRLARTAKLVACGGLSFGYAAAICEAVDRLSDEDAVKAEDILLGMVAEGLSVRHVAKAGVRIKDVIDERDGTEPEPPDALRGDRSWLQLSKSLRGGAFVKGRFGPELTALVLERLGRLAKPAGPEDTRDHAERMADALELLLSGGSSSWNATLVIRLEEQETTSARDAAPEAAQGAAQEAGERAPQTESVEWARSADEAAGESDAVGESAGGRGLVRGFPVWPLEELGDNWRVSARLADGTPIPIGRARQIALNAGVSLLMLGPDGIPLYLGDRVRFVTAGQRRVLNALYATCAFAECDIPATLCEIDHVVNFSDYPLTDIDLLAPCCSFHNRLKFRKAEQISTTRDARGRWQYRIQRARGLRFRRAIAHADGDTEARAP
ncbi:MAG: endonuclease [Actinomycetia bacterium]|nr:endonuclease [Actinomycetes bacterium]